MDAFDQFTELILVITIFGGTMCNLESLGFGDCLWVGCRVPPGQSLLRRLGPAQALQWRKGLLSFTPGRALCREHRQRLREPLHRPGAHVFKADRRVRGRDRRRLAIDEDLTIARG